MKENSYLRLMTTMVAEMHQNAGLTGGVDSKLVLEALWANQDWAIRWGHDALLEVEENSTEVKYVVSVLSMWRWIEANYALLDESAKSRLQDEVPYNEGIDPSFRGFDGNEEGEYIGIARMFIEHLGRWDEFAGRDLNTHSRTTERYEAMLDAYEKISAERGHFFYKGPDLEGLIEVLSAPYKSLDPKS